MSGLLVSDPSGNDERSGVLETLPDLLADSLDVVFVGINPSIYSAERGRYFARPGNRFWPCVSQSMLTERARAALGVSELGPLNDRDLQQYGIGFTDVAKRPTAKASDLRPGELAAGVGALLRKFERYRPQIACFHGITGYRHVHDVLGGVPGKKTASPELGLQEARLGTTRLFLVPNPSGANAHFTRADQTRWYDTLAAAVRTTRRPS